MKKNCVRLNGIIRYNITEFMRYFFYFIDLIFIIVLLLNDITIVLKSNSNVNKAMYIFIFILTVVILLKLLYKLYKIINYINGQENIAEEIIKINGYESKYEKSIAKPIVNFFRRILVRCSFKKTFLKIIILGLIMIGLGYGALNNRYISKVLSIISIYYFITRPLHYFVVFYNDFKNKIKKNTIENAERKIRYIKLTVSNYIKINLEFCILIYILKYVGWTFINIKINTYFELFYTVLTGNLNATTSVEMFIDLLRIATLGMVVTLNLACYMDLDIKSKNTDKKIKI
ncbi:hypothetical protein QTH69_06870 [Clostridium perfringens]|nr:hypothetical protein [Clostridium perfringens]